MQRSHGNRISTNIADRMSIFENTVISPVPIDTFGEEGSDSGGSGGSGDSNLLFRFQSPTQLSQLNLTQRTGKFAQPHINAGTMMSMSSSPPPGVQTDADGLIIPKKLINPCLESTDRKELHRELKFNTKIGKSVLNQKSELQRAYEKHKEKQNMHQQQNAQDNSPTAGLKSELNRVIMERAQKHEHRNEHDGDLDDDRQYVNPEYLNARAKLRHGQHSELQ